MKRPLCLIELNELNFDIVREYLLKGCSLPNFQKLIGRENRLTTSEKHYHLLEPWIQWPSVHTGLTFDEHNIFEVIERSGMTVGAMSPMNAVNRLLAPKYFIPDPWTDTPSDGSLVSRMLTSALKQAVNDNSQERVTLKSKILIGLTVLVLTRPRRYLKLLAKFMKIKKKPWRRALFLDRLLHEMHLALFLRRQPDFSTIFLNAGAHIQHHYFLNAKSDMVVGASNPSWYVADGEDPVGEMLTEYDEMLGDLLNLKDTETLVATGLTQTPVDRGVFYYRLRNHEQFFAQFDLPIVNISPRMTRDFLVSCKDSGDAKVVESALASVVTRTGIKLFGEVDNRGKDLFVTLDYSFQITHDTEVRLGGKWQRILDDVVFVAVKNGEHDSKGFAYFSPGLTDYAPADSSHVASLYSTICNYFGVPERADFSEKSS